MAQQTLINELDAQTLASASAPETVPALTEPERAELGQLLHLAQRVKNALPQVKPRAEFVAELKAQLQAQWPKTKENPDKPALSLAGKPIAQWVWWVAGIGGAVVGVVAALVGWRTWRANTMKSAAH